MPVTFRSKAWLQAKANKLKPKVLRASSASGGARKPRPSWTVWPFSATAASKLVNTTSPFSSDWITGTAAGAVSRMSDRIMDCPVNVIVMAGEFAVWAAARVVRVVRKAARRAAFNVVVTWIAFRYSSIILDSFYEIGCGEKIAVKADEFKRLMNEEV